MEFAPSSLANPSTITSSTLSGVTIVASTASGLTSIASTLSGATIVSSTINSGNTVSPYALARPQTVFVHRSLSGQTISNTTATKIHHNSVDNDPDSVFDNVTNYRMTPTVTGTYLLSASVGYLSQVSGYLITSRIYKNGSNWKEARAESVGSNITAVISAYVIITTGDYLEHYTYQESGGDLDMDSDETVTFFQAMWVSK